MFVYRNILCGDVIGELINSDGLRMSHMKGWFHGKVFISKQNMYI